MATRASRAWVLALSLEACGGSRRPPPVVSEAEPAPEIETSEVEGSIRCPAIEVLPNPVSEVLPEAAEAVRAAFESVARGESSSAFDDATSTMLAVVARLHACPARWDGEHVTFLEPELRTLPLSLEVRFDQAPSGRRYVIPTGPADDDIARRSQIDTLCAWLDAHPGVRLSGNESSVVFPFQARHLDARTVLGSDLFCRERDGRWACADPATARRIGRVPRVEERGSALWVAGQYCDGGSESAECSHALHLLAREGAVLEHRGSIGIGYMRDEHSREIDEGTTEVAGSSEAVRYPWTAGDTCAVLGEPVVEALEYHEVHPERGRARVHRVPQARSVRYGARPDRLATFAVMLDPSGIRFGGEMGGTEVDRSPVLEDRRGAWQLEPQGWTRTERCDAR